jgi:hypothetical protein
MVVPIAVIKAEDVSRQHFAVAFPHPGQESPAGRGVQVDLKVLHVCSTKSAIGIGFQLVDVAKDMIGDNAARKVAVHWSITTDSFTAKYSSRDVKRAAGRVQMPVVPASLLDSTYQHAARNGAVKDAVDNSHIRHAGVIAKTERDVVTICCSEKAKIASSVREASGVIDARRDEVIRMRARDTRVAIVRAEDAWLTVLNTRLNSAHPIRNTRG